MITVWQLLHLMVFYIEDYGILRLQQLKGEIIQPSSKLEFSSGVDPST